MKVDLVDHMGDDNRVVNAARVSFAKEAEGYTEEENNRLIRYLAKHGHWTPFSHPQVTVREKVPIFVARQRFKHMVGFTYNEVSRRYVDDPPEFFVPDEWRSRPDGSVKQGSSEKEITRTNIYGRGDYELSAACSQLMRSCEKLYLDMINSGVAPEQARMVLPQSMYTEYYVTGSLAAWARAYKQRVDPHSQKEIQNLAKMWGDIIEPLFPVSWRNLID